MKLVSISLETPVSSISFLQTSFWARFKAHYGWKPYLYAIKDLEEGSSQEAHVLVLIKPLVGTIATAYIPRAGAPLAPRHMKAFASALKLALKKTPYKVISCEADFAFSAREAELLASDPSFAAASKSPESLDAYLLQAEATSPRAPWHYTKLFIQPEATVLLSIGKDAEITGGSAEQQVKRRRDARLMAMHQKTRNVVKKAERDGVRVEVIADPSDAELRPWYEIMQDTAKRQQILSRSYEYYAYMCRLSRDLRETDPSAPRIYLALAYADDRLISGYFLLGYKHEITTLYGGSLAEGLKKGAPSKLYFEIANYAEDQGYRSFDLYGIPRHRDDKDMGHLYSFKTKLGGDIVYYGGTWYTNLSVLAPLYRFLRLLKIKIRKSRR